MVTEAETKLARVLAALRVAVEALERHGLDAPAAEAAATLANLSEDDQAYLENTEIYELAEIEAELRTWGMVDGDSVWWLFDRAHRHVVGNTEVVQRDGGFPVPAARLEAARELRKEAWLRSNDQYQAGYADGYRAECERGDRRDREVAALRAALDAVEAPGFVARMEEKRRLAADREARRGRVPPLDDTTRFLLQDLRRHVASTLGTEQAARIMPMVGSYMTHAAAGWGPIRAGAEVPTAG